MNGPIASASLRLSCRPCLGSGTYSFPYEVENLGSADLFVMDATPGMDPESRMASANEQAGVVMLTADDEAVLGKFPARLPTDRRIAVPVIPLARRLAPGERLRRELRIPAPLAETSPYFPDLPLRRYEIRTVMTVVFAIGYWVAGVDNLVAAPTEHDPELFLVVTRNTLASALRTSQRFPTHGLQFFKRTDAFPRTL